MDERINLLAKIARTPSGLSAAPQNQDRSILMLAAAAYGSRPSNESTAPTGFDPFAVALFEAIVEGAYLVATADGVFDEREQATFERIVVAACGGSVTQKNVAALVGDLSDQVAEDGLDQRIKRLTIGIQKPEQAMEVLRIGALMAQVSEDVSDVERAVLAKIAAACSLGDDAVERAIADVRASLA